MITLYNCQMIAFPYISQYFLKLIKNISVFTLLTRQESKSLLMEKGERK